MGKILYGIVSPHPPILIPEIGGGRAKDVEKTTASLEKVSKKLKTLNPDTVIFITPHGEISDKASGVYGADHFEGNFSMFGLSNIKVAAKGDTELAEIIIKKAHSKNIPVRTSKETFLDHGIMVPLHFIKEAGVDVPILPIAISVSSLKDLFIFGKAIADTVLSSKKNVAVVASADMSHRLTKNAPNGYDPNGIIFDKKLIKAVTDNDIDGIIDFDGELAESAGQDALWSIAMLLGALDGAGFTGKVLSYEGPFGVGYMVAEYEKEK